MFEMKPKLDGGQAVTIVASDLVLCRFPQGTSVSHHNPKTCVVAGVLFQVNNLVCGCVYACTLQ